MSLNPARLRMVSIGNIYAAHASLFNYSEAADRAEIFDLTYDELVARLNAGESITGDCSSTYEATRKNAGCVNLPPLGYTGTELDTMPHITVAKGLPGDAIVFGAYPGRHVVWITEADPTNPRIDSHGQPGFQQTTLQEMWAGGFAGEPITVLSLAPYLPKPVLVPSYHYDYYDSTVVGLPHGRNSERAVVQNYDKARQHPLKNKAELVVIETNLAELVTSLQNIMRKQDPKGLKFHRAYRLPRLVARANGEVIRPDLGE